MPAQPPAVAPLSPGRSTGRGGIGVGDVASLVLLAVAVGALWWQPTRVFACAPQAAGLARCEVSTRLLGLVPLGRRTIADIAYAGHRERTETGELRDATTNRRSELETRVEGLLLADAEGRKLWSSVESHLLGASLEDVADGIKSRIAGEATPFVAWYVPWPPLLLASLFLLIATSHLGTLASLALRRRGLLGGVSYGLAYWLPTLLVAGVLALAWLVALAGAHPPRWLAGIS